MGRLVHYVYLSDWQSWRENQHVEIRKPGQTALGSFAPCFWNLKGIEVIQCNPHVVVGCIGLCCVYMILWFYILVTTEH